VPRLEPFAALRYDPSLPLDDLIAPPYDVVGPEERAKLASRHRANSIHVELPEEDSASHLDKYRAAERLLDSWVTEGLLRRDDVPSMYPYRMTGPDNATTTGIIGALACEPPGGNILPHEQTIPKDKSDRLELLRTCHANLSPIWGLSLAGGLNEIYQPLGPSDRFATDDAGVLHELWVIDNPDITESISRAVDSAPMVIADGHHRYETALAYRSERRAARNGAPGDYDFVMALVVELTEDQVSVGAVHRVLEHVPDMGQLLEVVNRWFECERVGDATEHLAGELVRSGTLGLLVRDGTWALTPRHETYETAGSDLDSSLVALALDDVAGAVPTYRQDWRDALDAVLAGVADAALLLRPVTVAQISDWAHARRRMPPKSTYFQPKPRTGMVFRSVTD
jgi:uncharacterized protein (DUF1015 family)